MLQTVAKLLPFAVGGAFLPSWTSRVILLLDTARPLSNATAYVAGNVMWRLLLGFTTIFVVSVAAPHPEPRTFAVPVDVAWAIAAALAIAGIWLLARARRADGTRSGRVPAWIDALKQLPPWAAFGYGAYNCAMPGAQWAYFLGGCAVIASSGLAWQWRIVLLVSFIAVLESMLVTPIVIYTRSRDEAQAVFAGIEGWLAVHAPRVIGGIFVMMGALFVYLALAGGRFGGSQ